MFGLHSQLPDLNIKQIRDKFIYLILLDKVKHSQKNIFLINKILVLALLYNIGTKFGHFQLNTYASV